MLVSSPEHRERWGDTSQAFVSLLGKKVMVERSKVEDTNEDRPFVSNIDFDIKQLFTVSKYSNHTVLSGVCLSEAATRWQLNNKASTEGLRNFKWVRYLVHKKYWQKENTFKRLMNVYSPDFVLCNCSFMYNQLDLNWYISKHRRILSAYEQIRHILTIENGDMRHKFHSGV